MSATQIATYDVTKSLLRDRGVADGPYLHSIASFTSFFTLISLAASLACLCRTQNSFS